MSRFYTSVMQLGNNILIRGYEDGKRIHTKVDFKPTLFVSSKTPTKWKTLTNEYVGEIQPGSIHDTKEFIKSYGEVENFKIYGMQDFTKQFISEYYQGEIEYDQSVMNITSIDIETTTEHGLSIDEVIKDPVEEITLISVKNRNSTDIVTFGTKDYDKVNDDGPYIKCQSEAHLLREFMTHWTLNYPDIVTGWNTNGYDFPYLIRRMARVIDDQIINKLSPWGRIRERLYKDQNGNEKIGYNIEGINMLDYKELFAKFGKIQVDDMKLDTVANTVLGEKKLENPYNSFKDFYTKDWSLFVDYNRHDVRLVDKLDEKLKLIQIAVSLAYYSKINLDEVYGPVNMWDSIIYNRLKNKNIVIPPKKNSIKTGKYEGAYVQIPVVGKHKYIASFDLASLYPHLIMQYNISPETLTDTRMPCTVDELLSKSFDNSYVKDQNLSLSANGWCYRRDVRGFLPEIMEEVYADRSNYKKEMLKYEQLLESDKYNVEYQNAQSSSNAMQLAVKEALNSVYGAIGNSWFRYYDLRMAESITLSGQLSNRWNANMLDEYFNKANKTEDVQYVIAGDTDSNYLTLEAVVESVCKDKSVDQKISFMDSFCAKIVEPLIDRSYIKLADYMNSYEQKMKMKREVLADVGVFVAKKRYFLRVYNSEGVQYAEPKLKVTGLELVKSSTPQVCRKKLKDSLNIILDGDQDQINKYVNDFKIEFESLETTSIGRPSGINGLKKFSDKTNVCIKGTPMHVRGALWYNHLIDKYKLSKTYEKILDSDKVKVVFLRTPNPINQNVISIKDKIPEEFGLQKYIDYDTQFEKVFVDPLQIMLEPIGWKLNNSANLDDFFG